MTGKEKAKVWLEQQIEKYGNTYYFPESKKVKLNKLIEKYGNTYYW